MKNSVWKLLLCTVTTCSLVLCGACRSGSDSNVAPSSPEEPIVDLSAYDNISILDYGAKADGSADITQAIEKVSPLLGKHQAVYFPTGTYLVSQDLTVNCPIKVSGQVTILVQEGKQLVFNGLFGAPNQTVFAGEGTVRINSEESYSYPQWFSQRGDDDTVWLQKAIDSARSLYIPDGEYQVGELTITRPCSIQALGARRVTLRAKTGLTALFNIQSNDVSIQGFHCRMNQSPEAVCFYFNNSAKDLSGIRLIACEVSEGITSLTDANSSFTVSNVFLDSVDFTNVRGTAIHMRDFSGNIELLRVVVHRRQYNNPVYNMGVPGAIFENANGMVLKHFDVNGEANVADGVYREDWINQNIGGHGVVFRNCSNVKMTRSLMEYLAGTAFLIENCTKFTWENVSCYGYHGYGFDINGLTDSNLSLVKSSVNGGYMERTEENFRFRNCKNVEIDSLITNFSRGKAVTMENCSDITVKSMSIFEKKQMENSIGLYDAGNNKNVVISSLIDSGTDASLAFVSVDNGIQVKKLLSNG